jgi:hypothetical protein
VSIDTSEPALVQMFEKGQVGRIRTEFMRKDDVIADLQAEVERLRGQVEHYIAALGKQEVLNQRLVKAGDDMASKITFDAQMEDEDWGVDTGLPESVKAWRAAKETQP